MSELSDLLKIWEDRWRREGVPVEAYLAPPASRERAAEALASIALPACEEVVDWFTWHNGARLHPGEFTAAPSPFFPLSLDQAIADRTTWQELARTLAEEFQGEGFPEREDPEYFWDRNWLPIARDAGPIVVALELSPGAAECPVRVIDPRACGEDSYRQISSPSLTAAVKLWVDWLDHGEWSWSTERAHWDGSWESVPLDVRLKGLI